jgi:hypothetical protein
MNPVIVISTHKRKQITATNIEILLHQVTKQQIIIVVSEADEAEYYYRFGVNVCVHNNEPLGAKWQHGVDYARKLHATHVIITGSDDILCRNFIQRFCTGEQFCGLQRWFIWEPNVNKLYLFNYNAVQCLGGGRVYNAKMLDSYNWQIFKKSANKILDDAGWNCTNPLTRRIEREEGCILAVKGNWPVMNPVEKTLQSRNATLISKWDGEEARYILDKQFNFKV